MPNDVGQCFSGESRGVVRRTIVNHHDIGIASTDLRDNSGDYFALIEGRDDYP
jgi:hypothetical protein